MKPLSHTSKNSIARKTKVILLSCENKEQLLPCPIETNIKNYSKMK